MKEDVLKYIENEKEISQYNIHMLERGEQTPARKRLIEIEREFLSLPLQDMNFSSVTKVAEAIELYQKSRKLFYEKYNVKCGENLVSKFSKKLSFLDKISTDLMGRRVEEVNLVQDRALLDELVDSFSEKKNLTKSAANKILQSKSLKCLQDLEPIVLSKKRARLQSCLHSLGLYISEFIDKEINFENADDLDLPLLNSKIDNLIFNLDLHIYKFYNESIQVLPSKCAGTMGENPYLEKSHTLENVFDLYHTHTHACVHTVGSKTEIDLTSPKLGNLYLNYKDAIYSSYTKDSQKESKNRVYGIVFPIERTSREKMSLLYHEIKHKGIDITELFCDSISNIRVDKSGSRVYYKGIFMKPLWQLLNLAASNNEYHWVISKLLDENLSDISNFNNKEYIKYINSKKTPFIDIDLSSRILSPRTRSEEQYLEEVSILVNKRILDIQNDYKNII